ncbi:MAG: UDP-N-acetylglucosamine 1-carboxyvinyltransferase [Rhizobiales bacterium]|nr:UDP-N-acetylglucosamine 1-carboxyvinyltransferase [Hyphomicrobiales bacterium]MBL6770123.1 UDP-N-acetylglucosamine 1-carboxyvinyltransferase [Hyphomicrobiales bacterium]
MDKIRIVGGTPLIGSIQISGSKNASLPIMIASILTDQELILDNLPNLSDISRLELILKNLGAVIERGKNLQTSNNQKYISAPKTRIKLQKFQSLNADYEDVSKMRASFLVLGPLLAREKFAKVSMPGGCAIGTRPVDIHLDGLKKLGAEIEIEEGYVVARAKNGLTGANINLKKQSVGATQNLMMAACLARGETTISNASMEPETKDLIIFLNKMGASIEVSGNNTILIQGQQRLSGANHKIIADRIEAGTYAIACCATGGRVILSNCDIDTLELPLRLLQEIGCNVEKIEEGILVENTNKELSPIEITTQPYPGFPTDLQAQFMALLTQANGVSIINEKIFENRFMHVQELARMGAKITLDGDKAIISGKSDLIGAQVMATDLRASVSLVIAGLTAVGETIINRVYHLDRGFDSLEKKLSNCGAIIERIV